ncbi:hypothetical protein DMENIID0001_088320 [Sergentomyia squamirostris]
MKLIILLSCCIAVLKVQVTCEPPIITEEPSEDEVLFHSNLDEKLVLKCRATGDPEPRYSWFRNGREVESFFNNDESRPQSGALVILKPTLNNTGIYQCRATNRHGTSISKNIVVRETVIEHSEHEKLIDLKVHAKPYFIKEPSSIEDLSEGSSLVFECQVSGSPQPTVQWIWNGKAIEESQMINRITYTGSNLEVVNVTMDDTGTFGCNATNNYGSIYKEAYLFVPKGAPSVATSTKEPKTVIGGTATFECLLQKSIYSEVKWFRGNERIALNGRFSSPINGMFRINNVAREDAGDYRCFVSNRYGDEEKEFSLVVKTKEEAERDTPWEQPQNFNTYVNKTGCIFTYWTSVPMEKQNGNGVFGYIITSRQLSEYGYSGKLEKHVITDGTQSSFELCNLEPFKVYELKIYAYNNNGPSSRDSTAHMEFSGGEVPLWAPTNVKAELVDKNIRVTWNPVLEEYVRDPFIGYKVDVWRDKDEINSLTIPVQGNQTSILVRDLNEGTMYHLKVKAYTFYHDGPDSDDISFNLP